MERSNKSSKRDSRSGQSLERDVAPRLTALLRAARLDRQLSQRALAEKLGLHQRQISDLERGTTDSRLTTVQNVARALDLELTLVPRHLISAVEALQRAGTDAALRPLYGIDDERESDTADSAPFDEIGDAHTMGTPSAHRPKKGPR